MIHKPEERNARDYLFRHSGSSNMSNEAIQIELFKDNVIANTLSVL